MFPSASCSLTPSQWQTTPHTHPKQVKFISLHRWSYRLCHCAVWYSGYAAPNVLKHASTRCECMCVCVCVCVCVCMYVCMYVCMHAFMSVYMCICTTVLSVTSYKPYPIRYRSENVNVLSDGKQEDKTLCIRSALNVIVTVTDIWYLRFATYMRLLLTTAS
jgi:hypothetical protein